MIPYDDLVAALSSWRARQGLPTGQLSGAPAVAKPAVAAAPAASAARSSTMPGSGANPASARVPVRAASEPAMPADDFIEEGSFDSEIDAAFGSDNLGEATAIGSAPTPTSPPRRR